MDCESVGAAMHPIVNADRKETVMGTRNDYAYGQSDYLKAETLAGKSIRVIISDVEDVGDCPGRC